MDLNPIHHPSPAPKNEMLVFGLHSTSNDLPGWAMDSNPVHHPSPASKNEMLNFGLHSTYDQPSDLSDRRSIIFTFWQCSSFVMGNVPIGSPYSFTRIFSKAFMLWEIYLRLSDNVDNDLLHLLVVQFIYDGQCTPPHPQNKKI